jgi:hypothetical protein
METNNKFTVIYSFKVVEGREEEFINCWKDLTQLIYEFEGSYGSRLHMANDNLYIGYAQWPSKEILDRSGNNLSESGIKLKQRMQECCTEIKKEFELGSILFDLLREERHSHFLGE